MTTKHILTTNHYYISLTLISAFVFTPLLSVTTYADEIGIFDSTITSNEELPLEALMTESETESPGIVDIESSTSSIEVLVSQATTTVSTTSEANLVTEQTATTTVPEIIEEEHIATTTITNSSDTASSSSDATFSTTTLDILTSHSQVATSTIESSTSTEHEVLPTGTTTITTGSSIATANILNLINTTSINSVGAIILQNTLNPQNTDIDLRVHSPTSTCTILSCNGVDTSTIKITADAVLDNTVVLTADSGNNNIVTADVAEITTGNVYAGLNLINIANTTLIDSNYLLVSLNIFDSLDGDIVLPALSTFFTNATTSERSFFGDVSTNLDASISNSLAINAISGDNHIDTSSSTLQTGNTHTSLSAYTTMNTISIGGNSLLVLLRVTGTWLGTLVGTQPSLGFTKDGDVHVLQLQDTEVASTFLSAYESSIESTSTIKLTNSVNVLANSGNNSTTDTTTSTITTGDAYASANIINIANTHIIGRNWMLAFINIFGDFNGDIAFGRPDLWIGTQVLGEAVIANDTSLSYTITVTNKGDNTSTNVVVTSLYDSLHLTITDSSDEFTDDKNGNLIFSIGDLLPGESHVLTFQAQVIDTVPGTGITVTTNVSGKEKDNNKVDNTDVITIHTTTKEIVYASGGGYQYIFTPIVLVPHLATAPLQSTSSALTNITVTRVSSSTNITSIGEQVVQTIIVKNLSALEVPSVQFNDYFINSYGAITKTESWDLGTLLPFEEVTLTYSSSFTDQTASGKYTLSSELLGEHAQTVFFSNNGTVSFVPNIKVIIEQIATSSTVSSSSSNQSLTSEKWSTSTPSTSLGFFRGTVFETVYGASDTIADQSTKNRGLPSSLEYMFLFLAFSVVALLRNSKKVYTV